jgi:hypothetical protein
MRKAGLLLVPFFLGLVCGQSKLQIDSVRIPAGSLVIVPVRIEAPAPVSGFQFRLDFDGAWLSVPAGAPVLRGDRLTDHSILTRQGTGFLEVFVFSSSLAALKAEPGTVAQIIFETSPSLRPGNSVFLDARNALAYSTAGEPINLDVAAAFVFAAETMNEIVPPVDGQNRRFFPQVAEGSSAVGTMRFALMLTNQTEASVSGRVRFYLPDGAPFNLELEDERSDAEFDFRLGPRGSTRLSGKAQGELKIGYAVLEASGPTTGTLVLSITDGEGVARELGVTASESRKGFSLSPQYRSGEADTGVAIINPGAVPASGEIILRDSSGIEWGHTSVTLAAREHRAAFLTEFFPALAETGRFLGVMEVIFDQPVAILGLRQNSHLFLTTIPVF